MKSTQQDLLIQIVSYAQRMASEQLALGTSGNLSVRIDTHTMAITPTGVPYESLTPELICLVDIATGLPNSDGVRPSSESPMHTAVYRSRPDIGAIVHTHSLHATAFAVANRPIQAVHYVIATMGDEIPVVPYFTYGTDELAAGVADTLKSGKAALLANHGVLALGDTLSEAYYHAQTVEYLAQLSLLAAGLGGANLLADHEIARVRDKFKGYGQTGNRTDRTEGAS